MISVEPRCRVCQNEKQYGEEWFLVIGNYWEDRLRILPWTERLATAEGVHAICSPWHVQQLVAHWMATGSLDYPFAHRLSRTSSATRSHGSFNVNSTVITGRQPLGELAVDRESLRRLLMERPESLVPVLDALVTALYSGREEMPSIYSAAPTEIESTADIV